MGRLRNLPKATQLVYDKARIQSQALASGIWPYSGRRNTTSTKKWILEQISRFSTKEEADFQQKNVGYLL